MASETGIFTVRTTAEKQRELDAAAAAMDRSRAWVVNRAIEQFLDVYRWQEAEIRKAVDEADRGGKFYSSKEIDRLVAARKPREN